jgi:hypothetical protein
MLAGRSSAPPVNPAGPSTDNTRPNTAGWVEPEVLRRQGQQMAAGTRTDRDDIRPGHEPKRKYLTDPPAGYRMPDSKYAYKRGYAAPVKRDNTNPAVQYQIEQAKRDRGLNPDDADQ